jgi:hypothetical protein
MEQVRDAPKSGRGQPHSKTLARFSARCFFRKVLECGCPLPLRSLINAGIRQPDPFVARTTRPPSHCAAARRYKRKAALMGGFREKH